MNTSLLHSRIFPYNTNALFEKYSDPVALARWWGPKWNSNTFQSFDFREGWSWIFTMHSDGNDYHNEWKFLKIEKNHIIMEHSVAPFFSLEVLLEEVGENATKMTWIVTFQSEAFFTEMKDFLREKNEENFDRLEADLAAYIS